MISGIRREVDENLEDGTDFFIIKATDALIAQIYFVRKL
jgi:hypothetical protein